MSLSGTKSTFYCGNVPQETQDLKAGTFFETVKKEDYRRRRRVKQKWVKRIDDSFLKLFGATTLGSESQSGQNQVEGPTMHHITTKAKLL